MEYKGVDDMLVFSRKKLEFRIGDGSTVTVEPLIFNEVPESVKHDNQFKWTLADGTIEVVESKTQ